MRLLSKCEKIVFQGRCWKCGSLIELTKEEFSELDKLHFDERPACPSCGDTLMLLPKSISKFYINEDGVYSRG